MHAVHSNEAYKMVSTITFYSLMLLMCKVSLHSIGSHAMRHPEFMAAQAIANGRPLTHHEITCMHNSIAWLKATVSENVCFHTRKFTWLLFLKFSTAGWNC